MLRKDPEIFWDFNENEALFVIIRSEPYDASIRKLWKIFLYILLNE